MIFAYKHVLEDWFRQCPNNVIFYICATVFFSLQMSLTVIPELTRDLPVELDDSLVYIFKAVLLRDCLQEGVCVALSNLLDLPQVNNYSPDDWNTFVLLRHTLHLYHLGHSFLMIGIKSLGLDWIESFQLIRITSALVIIISIICFIKTYFLSNVASLSLVFLSVTLFPEQGIHIVTPSNTVMGLFFLALSCFEKKNKYRDYQIFALSILMLFWHSIALILVPTLYIAYTIIYFRNISKQFLIFLILAAIFTMLIYMVSATVKWPPFHLPIKYSPGEWSGYAGTLKNLSAATKTFWESSSQFGGVLFLLAATVAIKGFINSFKTNEPIIKITFVLITVSLLSLFYVFPPKAGLLFSRMWVPLFVISICFLSEGLLSKGSYFFNINDMKVFEKIAFLVNKYLGLHLSGKLVPTYFLYFSLCFYIGSGALSIYQQISGRIDRHDLSFNLTKLELLVKSFPPNSNITYHMPKEKRSLDTVPLLITLIFGGAKNGLAIINDLGTYFEQKHQTNFDKEYLISWSPVFTKTDFGNSPLFIDQNQKIEILNLNANIVYLHFSNTERDDMIISFEIDKDKSSQKQQFLVKEGWNQIEFKNNNIGSKLIFSSDNYSELTGLSVNRPASEDFSWPWNSSILLETNSSVSGTREFFNFLSLSSESNNHVCPAELKAEVSNIVIYARNSCKGNE